MKSRFPFLYLQKAEKGTPFGPSLPVWAIICHYKEYSPRELFDQSAVFTIINALMKASIMSSGVRSIDRIPE